MKTSLLLVLVTGLSLVLTAGSCLQGKHVVGSKNYISQEVKADHFNEIKLLGSANISYHQDTRSHVEIHGSDNIIPLVETYVDGNTLMIKFKKNVSIWKGKLEIKVFAPDSDILLEFYNECTTLHIRFNKWYDVVGTMNFDMAACVLPITDVGTSH